MPFPSLHLQLHRLSADATEKSTEHSIPFDLGFEDAIERLEKLPHLFVELDGSFVWTSGSAAAGWQMDGMIYDRTVAQSTASPVQVSRIHWCEVTGQFDAATWQQFLGCVCDSRDGLHVYDLKSSRMLTLKEAQSLWT